MNKLCTKDYLYYTYLYAKGNDFMFSYYLVRTTDDIKKSPTWPLYSW